jgi:autotransporter-associated beta strand protein
MKSHRPRPTTQSALARPVLLGIASLAALGTAHAQATWVGDTSNDWNAASNWSSDPSNPTGNFTINTATGNYPVLSANSAFTPTDVLIGSTTGQTGRVDHSAGSLGLAVVGANGNWFKIGQSGGSGTYNLANTSLTGQSGLTTFGQGSGSLTVGKLFVGGAYFAANGTGVLNVNTTGVINAQSTQSFNDGVAGQNASVVVGRGATGSGTLNLENGTITTAGEFWVGSIGTGVVNQTGGTVNVGTLLQLARNNNNAQGGVGTWNVSGTGVVNVQGDLVLGFAGNSSAQGTMNIGAGATVNVATTTKRWLIVNRFDTVQGRLNVNGGALNLNANTDLRFSTGGGTGTSSVTLSSGSITAYSGNGTNTGAVNAVVDLNNAGGVTANNTFNLDGGTLTFAQVITNNDNGTAVFNFNGGTLRAAASDNPTATTPVYFMDLGGAGQRANVRNGGAQVDTNGFNVTIKEALRHSNIGGDSASDGGLSKSGLGKLTLSGVNTYTGPTTINSGTLALASTGSIATSSAIIANGTFDVSAVTGFSGTVVGATTISGTLAPGNSPGLLTFSDNLTLGASSNSQFEINGANRGSGHDAVDVGGTLTYGGALNLFFNAPIEAGTFDLFAGASGGGLSAPAGDFSSVSIGGTFAEAFSSGPSFQNGTGWTASSPSWMFSFDNATGDLTISAIPEPSAFAALVGLAGLGFVGARRRRR